MADKVITKRKVKPARTLADVAKALKVDPSTVSLVLSGSTKISERTRKRVLAYCEKANFTPNQMARGLSRGKSGLWGVLIPSIESSFFPQIVGGIEEVVNGLGVTAFMSTSNYDPVLLRRQLSVMTAKRVEGLLIVPTATEREAEILLPYTEEIPTVWLLYPLTGYPTESCVRVDNEHGGYIGTNHLIQHGHTRIAFLSGPKNSVVLKQRKAGWERALKEAGLPCDSSLVSGDDFSAKSGYDATMRLLDSTDPPTAFMASSDYAALGCIDALLQRQLVPGVDCAVVGFDGICCASHSPIPLTTVNQPKRELGIIAAQTLSALIAGSKPAMPMLQPNLQVRISSGCLSSAGR